MKNSASIYSSFKRNLCAVFLLLVLGLSGCALQTGTITRAPASAFLFSGKTSGVVVVIDDSAPVTLGEGSKSVKLPTIPGKHRVRVTRQGDLIDDREVLIGDQQSFEIALP